MKSRLLQNRAGLTLVELMVVVAILVLLVAVVLPLAQPALSGRNVREAARQINTFFQRARSEAMANDRPTGVMLVPSASNSSQCFELAMVRVPRPFAGTGINWGVVTGQFGNVNLGIGTTGDGDLLPEWELEFRIDGAAMGQNDPGFLQLKNLIRPNPDPNEDPRGETFQIRFDSKGPVYTGLRVDDSGTTYFVLPTGYNQYTPSPNVQTLPGMGVPFSLQREPRRTAASPIELPVGAYIDLTASGAEFGAAFNTVPGIPVKVLFDPNGQLQTVYAGGTLSSIIDSINLLIGRAKSPGINNLRTGAGGLWVSLNRSSGRIMTTENLGSSAPIFADALAESLLSVKTGQAMGGR